MDMFVESAATMHIEKTLFISASFGIFLALGNAWSVFFQTLTYAIVSGGDTGNHMNLVQAVVYVALASSVCLGLLVCLVKCKQILESGVVRRRISRVRSRARRPTAVVGSTRKARVGVAR